MEIKRINRASPEIVYIVVTNNSSTTMSTGHAVLWDYRTNTASTSSFITGNGYYVNFPRTTATIGHNPAHFAGIVAGRDIPAGEAGRIQVYGEVPYVIVKNVSNAPYAGAILETAITDASLTNMILRPLGLWGITTGAAATYGHMGVLTVATTIAGTTTYASADINQALGAFHQGGYCVPLSPLISANGSTITTLVATTPTQTATCKAFVHCLQ